MKNKIIYLITFLLLISSVIAVDTNYIFKKGQTIDLKIPCFESDYTYCPITTQCTITINYPNGDNLINNATMTFQNTYYNYTITQDKTTQLGEYATSINCVGNVESGFSTLIFEVTTEGSRIPMTTIFFIIIGFIYSIFIFALIKEDYTLTMLSAIGFLVIGVYMGINGIGNINNIMTQGFAVINIGIGAYVLIKAGIEEFKNNMGSE